METFTAGTLAYFDSLHRGAVPCKVLAIRVDKFDTYVTIRFTATRGWCKRGERYDVRARYIIPRKFVKFRKYGTTILPGWQWQ